jgi:hypothetical protein
MTERINPKLWESVKKKITSGDKGGNAGQWSARKAQMAVLEYKKEGGGYKGSKDKNNSLVIWTGQNWMTKSGHKSSETGERYLPKKAIENLTNKQYQETTKAKRQATKEGKQFSKQPKTIAEITSKFR